MSLNLFSFAFLFLIIFSLPLYWLFNSHTKIQNIYLLILSYIVYCWITFWLGILVFISTIFNYTTGILLGKIKKVGYRKFLVWFAIICNIAYLGVFKYFNFFSIEIANFLSLFGLRITPFLLILVIPVGISYFTLSNLSYNIEIYKRNIEPTKGFIVFAIFIAYFPKMIAGPIERPAHFINQISKKKHLSERDISGAIQLILIGLFKKIVIADYIGRFTTRFYENPSRFSSAEALLYVWLFIFQLYADFSGYTNIIRGISKLFGIELVINFHQPFLATNISKMWRDWHISLTSWLRDYVYIPLGGNRKGYYRTFFHIMIVFVISGLWHGSYLNMVIWGGLNGIYVIFHRIYRSGIENWSFYKKMGQLDYKISPKKFLISKYFYLMISWFFTISIFTFSYIFFATTEYKDAIKIVRLLFALKYDFSYDSNLYRLIMTLLFACIFIFIIDIAERKLNTKEIFTKMHWFLQGLCYIFILIMILLFQFSLEQDPFIYEGF